MSSGNGRIIFLTVGDNTFTANETGFASQKSQMLIPIKHLCLWLFVLFFFLSLPHQCASTSSASAKGAT
jgi:hypothetical protein